MIAAIFLVLGATLFVARQEASEMVAELMKRFLP